MGGKRLTAELTAELTAGTANEYPTLPKRYTKFIQSESTRRTRIT